MQSTANMNFQSHSLRQVREGLPIRVKNVRFKKYPDSSVRSIKLLRLATLLVAQFKGHHYFVTSCKTQGPFACSIYKRIEALIERITISGPNEEKSIGSRS